MTYTERLSHEPTVSTGIEVAPYPGRANGYYLIERGRDAQGAVTWERVVSWEHYRNRKAAETARKHVQPGKRWFDERQQRLHAAPLFRPCAVGAGNVLTSDHGAIHHELH